MVKSDGHQYQQQQQQKKAITSQLYSLNTIRRPTTYDDRNPDPHCLLALYNYKRHICKDIFVSVCCVCQHYDLIGESLIEIQ